MREWLIIESSLKNAAFPPPDANRKGYIPRSVAEGLLGRSMDGTQWFSREESQLMRAHPEWRDTLP